MDRLALSLRANNFYLTCRRGPSVCKIFTIDESISSPQISNDFTSLASCKWLWVSSLFSETQTKKLSFWTVAVNRYCLAVLFFKPQELLIFSQKALLLSGNYPRSKGNVKNRKLFEAYLLRAY